MVSFLRTIKFIFCFSGCALLACVVAIPMTPFKNSKKEAAALLGTLTLYLILEWSGDAEFTYTNIHSVFKGCLNARHSA